MTQEEKAKAYDEALLRADEAVQKGCLDKDMFDIIFPPEESEDERIRKRLLWFLANYTGRLDYTETRMACRAWLEKQKEQKPKATINGEPIPTENHSVNIPCRVWSDEDEKKRKFLIKGLEDRMGFGWACDPFSREDLISWLEDLGPQLENYDPVEVLNKIKTEWPMAWEKVVGKQEWSEEDSKRYISIGTTLGTSEVLTKEDYDANMAWLRELVNAKKSLRPSWKPSEEQLNALNFAITYFMHETNYKNPTELRDLYDELLKLK